MAQTDNTARATAPAVDRDALVAVIREDRKPRPFCRDCADSQVPGRCDVDGTACDPSERLADVLIASGVMTARTAVAVDRDALAEALADAMPIPSADMYADEVVDRLIASGILTARDDDARYRDGYRDGWAAAGERIAATLDEDRARYNAGITGSKVRLGLARAAEIARNIARVNGEGVSDD